MCKGLCPKCLEVKPLTKHHILPQRFFGGDTPILHLCRKCHDKIEEAIPRYEVLEKDEYFLIAIQFIQPAQQYGKVLQFPRRGKENELQIL